MINPLNNLPLNTKLVYVRGIAKSGCEIYMPVDSRVDDIIHAKKVQLQLWLDNQPDLPKEAA